MTLTFIDGLTAASIVFAMIWIAFGIMWRRCSNNTNEENQQIAAIIIRQTLLAERAGVEVPSIDDLVRGMGYNMPGSCPKGRDGQCEH